jgi:hypothetical protein
LSDNDQENFDSQEIIDDQSKIIDVLDLEDKQSLSMPEVSDEELRLFRDLKDGEKPIIPIPKEYPLSIHYPQFTEKRCAICSSPFRDLAEHVYIHNAKKPQEVIKFFERHFNAKLNWTQVQNHMESHCNLRNIAVKGLETYRNREEDVAEWMGREYYLVMLALLSELDSVAGIDCSKNPELKLKRASMVERLTTKIRELKKDMDDVMGAFNIFEILLNLHNQMESEFDKKMIRDVTSELRKKLQERQG